MLRLFLGDQSFGFVAKVNVVLENELSYPSSNPEVCIPHSTNTIEKNMNLTILSPAKGK